VKKVLIITYYWPPSGGGGVMRWLKMTKYFPDLGLKPIIYTPENPDPSVIDESLLNEIHPEIQIIKKRIWEPYGIYRKITGQNNTKKFKAGYISEASSGNWKNKLSVFIRGNLLIPDPRKFWIKPSIKFLKKILKKNPVDLIISTGPPHSMHLIALGIKKKLNIQWLADFRDPWTDIDFYDKLRLTKIADNLHHKLEKKVISNADIITTVSQTWSKNFERKYNKKVHVIPNGYDPDDFLKPKPRLDNSFSITHIGSFNSDRNPKLFWEVLNILCNENPQFKKDLKINLIGQTDQQVINDIYNNKLNSNLKIKDHIDHSEIAEVLQKSQILLLPINNTLNSKGIIPGKTFEYLAAERPVLSIGPTDGDTAKIIWECNAGEICDFFDKHKMKSIINHYYKLFCDKKLYLQIENHDQFSRRNLAQKTSILINSLL